MKIFILDWIGTLDRRPDLPGVINQMRKDNPDCLIILHTGWSSIPETKAKLFDKIRSKTTIFNLLSEFVKGIELPDSYVINESEIPLEDIEEVVVIDDEADLTELEYTQIRLAELGANIKLSGFRPWNYPSW